MQNTDDPTKEQVGEAKSTIEYSYDPNEIIGPEGYDSVRWVSINDVLNYIKQHHPTLAAECDRLMTD